MPSAFVDLAGNAAAAAAQAAARRAQQAASSVPSARPVASYTPVQSNSMGQYSTPINMPSSSQPGPVPDLEAFLTGDTGYQQQLRDYQKTLSDFTADTTRRKGTLESEYGLSSKALGDQRVKDLGLMEDDYGSRGLLRSGLYGKAVGDYETEYGQRSSDLARRQQDALAALEQETGAFSSQQKLQEQAAREAAIRRRAETYGIS